MASRVPAPTEIRMTVALAEYDKLKTEQLARISTRDNLLYAVLAASAAVVVAAFGDGGSRVLLALPPIGVILGWTYLVNDRKITSIGAYIRGDLREQVRALGAENAFPWETAHRIGPDRRRSKLSQAVIDLLAFCGGGLAALAIYWTSGPTPELVAVSLVDLSIVVALAVEIVRTALPAIQE